MNDYLLYFIIYISTGFIFSSILYIGDKITSKNELKDNYIETNFLFYCLFWLLFLIFYLLNEIKTNYFNFLDKISDKIKKFHHE